MEPGKHESNTAQFGETYKEVLKNAEEEAKKLGHSVVGTEHLLLGILATHCGERELLTYACTMILDDVRKEVESIVAKEVAMPEGENRGLSERAQTIIRLSVEECIKEGRGEVIPKHILKAIIKDEGNIAAGVFQRYGVNLSQLGGLLDQLDKPEFRETSGDIITQISSIIDTKLDNPEVVRRDPDTGIFTLDDKRVDNHGLPTEIEVTRAEDYKLIRFTEWFIDATPRHKPSVLVYDYSIDNGELFLEVDLDGGDLSPLAQIRLNQLLEDSTSLPDAEGERRYTISEMHIHYLLNKVKAMKIFIS